MQLHNTVSPQRIRVIQPRPHIPSPSACLPAAFGGWRGDTGRLSARGATHVCGLKYCLPDELELVRFAMAYIDPEPKPLDDLLGATGESSGLQWGILQVPRQYLRVGNERRVLWESLSCSILLRRRSKTWLGILVLGFVVIRNAAQPVPTRGP